MSVFAFEWLGHKGKHYIRAKVPNSFSRRMKLFLGNKTLDQLLDAKSNNNFFAKFYSKFADFCGFSAF